MKGKHSRENWSLCTKPDEISLLLGASETDQPQPALESLPLALCTTLGKQTFVIG